MADFQVNTPNDTTDANDGVLSLREAVDAANARAGADTITFADEIQGASLSLRHGAYRDLTITDDVVIDGGADTAGFAAPSIGLGAYEPVFTVRDAAARFEDLVIGAGETGVLGVNADLDMQRMRFEGLYSPDDTTGIELQGGSLLVEDSFIRAVGGEFASNIVATDGSDVVVRRSIIDEVTANYNGTGIFVEGSLRVEDSLITGFERSTTSGITVRGELKMINSTITGINAGTSYLRSYVVELLGDSRGVITNSTITGNTVESAKGDFPHRLFLVEEDAELRLENSLVLTNTNADVAPLAVDGTLTSNGGNVFGSIDVQGAAATDVLAADAADVFALLDVDGTPVLADNGGPTPTVALLDDPANPAIDAAVAADAPPVDGRGFARDAAPDIGAFEAGAVAPPPGTEPIVVTTAEDVVDAGDGVVSLREAVNLANVRVGTDTITFADDLAGATLALEQTNGTLDVTNGLVIDGDAADGGAGGVTIRGAVSASFPTFGEDITVQDAFLRLEDLTFQQSTYVGIFGRNANIALVRAGIDGSYSYTSDTSGIRADGGSVLLEGAFIADIRGAFTAYGVQGRDGADVRLMRSEITNVTAADDYAYGVKAIGGGRVEVVQSQITGIAGIGGQNPDQATADGIFADGDLSITGSTIAASTEEDTRAAGVRTTGTLELSNSTLVVDGEAGTGAVTLQEEARAALTNVTLVGVDDGDLGMRDALVMTGGASAEVANSIVAGNERDVSGTLTSNGGNVFGAADVDGAAPGDVLGADPAEVFLTGELADNGGPTLTIALKDDPMNPAIGQAIPADAPSLDQRGFERDADPDAGSFEADAGSATPPEDVASIDIVFVSADADYANSLGFYVLDEAGNLTGEARVLFPEVSDRALDPGDATGAVGFPGDLGLFLVRDGANLGIDWETGTTRIEDGRLVHEAPDGATTTLKDYQVHFDFEPGQLLIQESFPEIYNWEDKAVSENSYDGDFNDAVFAVTKERVPPPVLLPDAAPAVAAGDADLFGV